ncbi:hypothetical protein ACVIJ6_002245 [Bradyrhizobium sp. USDA 4369]
MRLGHAHQGGAQRCSLAGIDGDAGAAIAQGEGVHIVHAALAAGHDRQPALEAAGGAKRALQVGAVGGIEQFEIAADRVGDVTGVGGARIGGVDISERAIGLPRPDRPGQGGGERAQRLGLLAERLEPQLGLGELAAQARQFADAHDGLTANGAAHRLDGMAMRAGEMQQEAFAGLAQRIDRAIELQRRLRRQPAAEGEDALRLILGHEHRGVAGDLRAMAAGRPGDQDLRLGKQQRAVAIGLQLQRGDIGTQPRFLACGCQPRAHQRHGGDHREAKQRQHRRHLGDVLTAQFEQRRDCIRRHAIACKTRCRRSKRGRCEPDQALARE